LFDPITMYIGATTLVNTYVIIQPAIKYVETLKQDSVHFQLL